MQLLKLKKYLYMQIYKIFFSRKIFKDNSKNLIEKTSINDCLIFNFKMIFEIIHMKKLLYI
jgi:hypothetical protein